MMTEEIVISEAGSANRRLRISLDEYKGTQLLNIRYFYEDKEGNLRPTTKGIAISRNRYLDLAEAIQTHHELILDFLAGAEDSTRVRSSLAKEKEMAARHNSPLNLITARSAVLRKSELFDVAFEGSEAIVTVDSRNSAFSNGFEDIQSSSGLFVALVALEASARLISDDESREVANAVDRLMIEFKRQFSKFSNSIKVRAG